MATKTKKVKHPKMDPLLVAGKQKHEVEYIAKKFGIKPKVVRWAISQVKSRSRLAIYNFIRKIPKQ